MTPLTISMPPALQSWVDARLAEGRYTDAAEYVRDLVRRDRDRFDYESDEEVTCIRAMVEEGLASGIIDEEPEAVLARIIARVEPADG